MRLTPTAFLGAVMLAILGLDGVVSSANAQSCQQLWVERNSYYQRHGYCFRTARAINYFGNRGCYITNMAAVPLTRGERNRIAQIVALERAYGCSD